jgi:hypothetical protein
VLKKYKVDKLEALPVNFNGIRLQEGENYANVVFDRGVWGVVGRIRAAGLRAQAAGHCDAGAGSAGTVDGIRGGQTFRITRTSRKRPKNTGG